MQITGKNLLLVEEAVTLAILEVKNQIAMCPDVFIYEDYVDELQSKVQALERLKTRISNHAPVSKTGNHPK